MSFSAIMVLLILFAAILLFISEKIRVDLVALIVLFVLSLLQLITPAQALSGFSNPAVITIWAMFILSAGISATGLARMAGQQLTRLTRGNQILTTGLVMLSAGLMSAFMNNVGVAAMLLPVLIDISRRTKTAASLLLIPMAFGTLLGGLITLIATPANILLSDALLEQGFEPFGIFDFAPLGLGVLLAGVLFMMMFRKRLLPVRESASLQTESGNGDQLALYDLEERLFEIELPPDSELAGRKLINCRMESILGITILAVRRGEQIFLAPGADFTLMEKDNLIVKGRTETLEKIISCNQLEPISSELTYRILKSEEVSLAEMTLEPGSKVIGRTLSQINFRGEFGVNVIAIWRDGRPIRTKLANLKLKLGDTLLIQGKKANIDALIGQEFMLVFYIDSASVYNLQERMQLIRVPENSILVGKTIMESRLGEIYQLSVLGIIRNEKMELMITPQEEIRAEDLLLIEARPEDLNLLNGLQRLHIKETTKVALGTLFTEKVGYSEVILSPHSHMNGKSIREMHFREKYGLSVIAIWREGRAYRSFVQDMKIKFGDAMLFYGPREKLDLLRKDPDFIILSGEIQSPVREKKAPLAAGIMLAVILSVIFGWMPVSLAAIGGAVLMVLTGCLQMQEAYRSIEWPAVFLIAGMLPLGIAMEQSGAADWITSGLITLLGGAADIWVIVLFVVLSAVFSQFMPNAAVAVLVAPVAIKAAISFGISPYAMIMSAALGISLSLATPVAHPANVLIMGPGGYRFKDFLKAGVPLIIFLLIIGTLIINLIWM